jgi:hypothetical protein
MGSKDSVQLKLHSSIYLKGALQATKEAYEAYADVRFAKAKPDPYWIVDVTPLSDDFDGATLALEVANFVLAENMHAKRGEQA